MNLYKHDQYGLLKEILPSLVRADTGIIRSIEEMPRQSDMSDIFYYKAHVVNTGPLNDTIDNFQVTAGTSLIRDRAMAKAIGEGIER
jgi:hypothetical protein